ncbi:DUF4124 domain-containing protein [Marinicella sp. S1101]|uniref:DUF4124 domain-containing protein n=1 Tax=Marinicella marina TaxID=2996016 RepID=UPI002260FC96|nr:DUF4124 domain-containing protein [Marinicella marina]MCX7554269.1 DUF4124 domain-containing protein [Marinicella marina]MDJ1138740.1 DUF4124 domain-containing protein [Marinicella marina]
MIKTGLMLFLLCSAFGVQAQEEKKIYKYTDENGVTHYTETKPSEEYKEADLPELSVVPSRPVNNSSENVRTSGSEKDQEDDPEVVREFQLLEPVKEQNLWGTGGKLTAKVSPLTAAQKASHQVQFIIDGEKQKPADASTQVFENIYRGEHTVQGLLVNRYNQKVIKRTEKITFFMHQNSKK